MKLFDKVYFTLSNKRRLGYVLSVNSKTIWVKVMFGASNAVAVKRHIFKHNVKHYFTEHTFYETKTQVISHGYMQ